MARRTGYKKALDLLNCGNQLIREEGKRNTRTYKQLTAVKVDDEYILENGTNTVRTTDAKAFMEMLGGACDNNYSAWLAVEPDDRFKPTHKKPKVETLTLTLDSTPRKRRRR